MREYYKDDWCTIYHGDCKELLPQLDPVDLLLTDPPYGIGKRAGTISNSRTEKNRDWEYADNMINIKVI